MKPEISAPGISDSPRRLCPARDEARDDVVPPVQHELAAFDGVAVGGFERLEVCRLLRVGGRLDARAARGDERADAQRRAVLRVRAAELVAAAVAAHALLAGGEAQRERVAAGHGRLSVQLHQPPRRAGQRRRRLAPALRLRRRARAERNHHQREPQPASISHHSSHSSAPFQGIPFAAPRISGSLPSFAGARELLAARFAPQRVSEGVRFVHFMAIRLSPQRAAALHGPICYQSRILLVDNHLGVGYICST